MRRVVAAGDPEEVHGECRQGQRGDGDDDEPQQRAGTGDAQRPRPPLHDDAGAGAHPRACARRIAATKAETSEGRRGSDG